LIPICCCRSGVIRILRTLPPAAAGDESAPGPVVAALGGPDWPGADGEPVASGTSFMLQIGQLPGLSDLKVGCMGQ
jgi:hypothetical protein